MGLISHFSPIGSLESAGVQKFTESFEQLLAWLEHKIRSLAPS